MSRDEGFEVMDVSTSLPNDPKFRQLAREHPDVLGTAFYAYVATMAESWKAGERVSVHVAWPPILPHSEPAVTAMHKVKLLDPKGRVTVSAWRGYFEQARIRREKSRERWRRANEKRHGETVNPNGKNRAATSRSPRGAHAVTAPPIPSDSDRTNQENLSGENHGARATGKAERADVQALLDRGWPKVTKSQRRVLDEVLARHDVTGAEFAAQAIRSTPPDADPLAAVMKADALWQEAQRLRADAEERAWADEKANERNGTPRGTSAPTRIAVDDAIDWLADPVEVKP